MVGDLGEDLIGAFERFFVVFLLVEGLNKHTHTECALELLPLSSFLYELLLTHSLTHTHTHTYIQDLPPTA